MTTNDSHQRATTRKATSDHDEEQAADTPQIRALRIAVIAMSLLLVVGFVTVIARIIYLASRSSAPSPSAAAASTASPTSPVSLKPDVGVPLPAGASITGSHLDGGRLTLTYTAPGGSGVVVVDMESGKVLSRVRAMAESPR